jgi:hypothetical protein
VADAVGRQFVDREHEVLRRRAAQAGALAVAGHEPADLVEGVALERDGLRGRWRRCERRGERRQWILAPAVRGARLALAADRDDDRVAAMRLVEHVVAQCGGVVRTQELEAGGVGERDVQQRLVQLALDQLVAAAARPHGLPDAADRPAAPVLVEEVVQAGMIRPGLRPTSVISMNRTRPASAPRCSRSVAVFAGSTATITGSPASRPPRRKGSVPARYESSLSYNSASCWNAGTRAECSAGPTPRSPLR